jgi:prevent-host-death family protein
VPEITATDASRRFSDLLDAVEHRGEHFAIVRRGKVIAHLEPVPTANGRDVKSLLRRHRSDPRWSQDLDELRRLVEVEQRP